MSCKYRACESKTTGGCKVGIAYDCKAAAAKVIEYQGMKFSSLWDLEMGGRKYRLVPKADGMFNVFFFELLAGVIDENGQEVGMAFIELLPGVRNKNSVLPAFITKK